MRVADFNGDGRQDLAVLYNNQIGVMLGNGDGTFRQPVEVPGSQIQPGGAGYPNPRLAVGDLNGDGHLDIAFINGYGSIGIALGNGDGTFRMAPSLALPQYDTTGDLAIGDFNGDGHLDIAATDSRNAVDVFLGNGDGSFAAPAQLATPGTPVAIAAADLNGDGRSDLIVAYGPDSPGGPAVQSLLSQPDGTLKLGPDAPLPQGTLAAQLQLADLNGDGRPDLLVEDDSSGLVLMGQGGGAFGAAASIVPASSGGSAGALSIADFNLDHRPDVVTVSGDGVDVLLGNGAGRFSQLFDYAIGQGVALGVGDFNDDHRPDVVLATYSSIVVLPNAFGSAVPRTALRTDKACYVAGRDRTIGLSTTGFPAGDGLEITTSGPAGPVNATVGPGGTSRTALPLRYQPGSQFAPLRLTLTATDSRDATLSAKAAVSVTGVDSVVTRIPRGSFSLPLITQTTGQIYDFFGLPSATTVYGHYLLNGRLRRTITLGRTGSPCAGLRATVRQWPVHHATHGPWTIQFDGHRTYAPHPSGSYFRYRWILR